MTEQRVRTWEEICAGTKSILDAEQNIVAEVAALKSRLREADRIIAQAYRHCVMAMYTGDLAYAITAPLIEILTQSLGAP
jgi:hypothetical protein